MDPVLCLNADYSPTRIIGWEHAVELLLAEKALLVGSVPDRYIRSQRLALPWPSVIALKKYRTIRGRVKFSGKHVILRDSGRCSYCGHAPKLEDGSIDRQYLTHDHVVPRAQARDGAVFLPWSRKWVNVTSWENATTACRSCNSRKADRTPAQAGMSLSVFPRVPTHIDVMRISLAKLPNVPASWEPYLPGSLRAACSGEDLETAPLRSVG